MNNIEIDSEKLRTMFAVLRGNVSEEERNATIDSLSDYINDLKTMSISTVPVAKMRLRIGIEGKVSDFIPIKWTLYAENLAEKDKSHAEWVCLLLNGRSVSTGILNGKIFATISTGA